MFARSIRLMPVSFWLTLAWLTSSCTLRPLQVGVVFENGWRPGNETVTDREKTLVEDTALGTLREAYRAFDVQFSRGPSARRLIRIEEGPSQGFSPARWSYPGAVGATVPITTVSSVRVDSLYRAELAAVRCKGLAACATKTRLQLLEGLGRGIGATAAHELGHQAGLHFSRDANCDDCYDSDRANTYVHFFGAKHWSSGSLAIMQRVLAPSARRSPGSGGREPTLGLARPRRPRTNGLDLNRLPVLP
jgi:hypothetical protein